MVHSRLNERESNPNPHINFIKALPSSVEDEEHARQFLRALAAQVRPVMKDNGFSINSLEEYEHNSIFAGRNWNNGETVELVLRRQNGSFLPTSWLLSTLCHELAHIKHMNHGPAFQALWKRLRVEVRKLQDKGYYGDGYWSSGTRLADSASVSGDGIETGDLPEFMCGGAQNRTRPVRKRHGPQSRPGETVASTRTGRQTAKKRKAGGRVTSKYAFLGEGTSLAGRDDENGKGTGFRKQAQSKRAREERALATERRLNALKNPSEAPTAPPIHEPSDDEGSDSDVEFIGETDSERRQTLLAAEDNDDLKGLRNTSWQDFNEDFIFGGSGAHANHGSSNSSNGTGASRNGKGKAKEIPDELHEEIQKPPKLSQSKSGFVQSEIDLRKKESLGMGPGGRTLGANTRNTTQRKKWECRVCTLLNEPDHLACSACATAKGEETFSVR